MNEVKLMSSLISSPAKNLCKFSIQL